MSGEALNIAAPAAVAGYQPASITAYKCSEVTFSGIAVTIEKVLEEHSNLWRLVSN
jgi:hypothetical protein